MFNLKSINIWAVVVAWLYAVGLGSIWYGPLFSKSWMAAVGSSVDAGNPGLAMGVMLLTYFIMALAVALLAHASQAIKASKGLALGALIGIGLMVTSLLTNVLFENRSMNLFWINGVYAVLKFSGIGAIVGGWQKKK